MKTFRTLITLNLALGGLSVLALTLQFLALGDIARAEADTALEWRIVGIAMMVLAVFVVLTVVSLVRILRITSTGNLTGNM